MFTSADIWVISPAIALTLVGFLYLALDLTVRRRARIIGYLVVALMFAPLVLSFNLWFGWFGDIPEAGFNGLVSADKFAAFFQILIMLLLIGVSFGSIGYLKPLKEYRGEFLTLLILSAVGMLVLVSARELITLYVAFELTALPTTTMIAIRRDRRGVEAGVKFLILSAVGSAFMLFGIVFMYAYTGTTYLEAIGAALSGNADLAVSTYVIFIGFVLIVAGLAFKMSVAPWQLWVPDVYQGAPVPVVAFLSTASKASSFAALLTILYVAFINSPIVTELSVFLAILATISMVFGNVGALRQQDLKRLLGYSTVAQAGYILVGVVAINVAADGGELASIGAYSVMFYLASYGVTNLAVFFAVIALVRRERSSSVSALTGLFYRSKPLSLFLMVGLLSLLGLPLTAGFMAKVSVFGASAGAGFVWLLVVGVINSVVAAYYYLRVLRQMFFTTVQGDAVGAADADSAVSTEGANRIGSGEYRHELIAGAIATVAVIAIGVVPVLLLDWAREAAEALLTFGG